MKTISLSLFLMIAACGKIDSEGANRLNEVRKFEPLVVGSTEKSRINDLCNALKAKMASIAANPTQTLNFEVSKKVCSGGDEKIGDPEQVAVTVEINSPLFKLRRSENGLLFIHPDLETTGSGIMKEVCSDIDNLTSPKKLENGNALWFTTRKSSECTPSSSESCIQFETGVPDEESFRIVSKEWIKFKTDSSHARNGFFIERKTLSNALCAIDQTSESKVLLLP